MDFELGLWRSTLGETHPHHGFAVEMDFWPQSAHATALQHEGIAVYRLVAGLVGCFAGGGQGSQPAMFRKDLVPLLDAAVKRWRESTKTHLPLRDRLDAFLREVQRGFDALETPEWSEHFEASTVTALVGDGLAAVASTGLEQAFRVRGGHVERVLRPHTVLEGLTPAQLASLPEGAAELYGSMSTSRLSRSRGAKAPAPASWRTVELALEPGDTLVLVAGIGKILIQHDVIAELFAQPRPQMSAPELARALGEHLAAPSGWRCFLDDEARSAARWRVVSRASIAVLRAVPRASYGC